MNNNCSSRCQTLEVDVSKAETLLTQKPSTSIRACSPRTARDDDPGGLQVPGLINPLRPAQGQTLTRLINFKSLIQLDELT